MLSFDDPLLEGYRSPPVMAIGDSIFNGVRSLTISRTLARSSPPAQLAQQLGVPLRVPDYPDVVLFDFEALLRVPSKLLDGQLLGMIRGNADAWVARLEAGVGTVRFHDNIAVAQAKLDNLWIDQPDDLRMRATILKAQLATAAGLPLALIADLYYAINGSFVLDPTNLPELGNLSALDQVALRRPRRLLVNIGSNEGLFALGLTADLSAVTGDIVEISKRAIDALAPRLAAACTHVERVYYNLLIRPRALANLAPRRDVDFTPPPGDAYFPKPYASRLIPTFAHLTPAAMKTFDEQVAAINAHARQTLGQVLGDKIRFVDLYTFADRIDGKHHGDARKIAVDDDGTPIRLSNLPMTTTGFGFKHGGLFGLDNMHPTTVGYAALAQEMLRAVDAVEGGNHAGGIDFQSVYDRDTLLQSPPFSLENLQFLLSLLTQFMSLRGGSV
jgi:hypothetical protein